MAAPSSKGTRYKKGKSRGVHASVPGQGGVDLSLLEGHGNTPQTNRDWMSHATSHTATSGPMAPTLPFDRRRPRIAPVTKLATKATYPDAYPEIDRAHSMPGIPR